MGQARREGWKGEGREDRLILADQRQVLGLEATIRCRQVAGLDARHCLPLVRADQRQVLADRLPVQRQVLGLEATCRRRAGGRHLEATRHLCWGRCWGRPGCPALEALPHLFESCNE